MIKPAHIPRWKRPPKKLAAVFEPHERFQEENVVSADHFLFYSAQETIPLMVISGEEAVMMHEQKTLGQSQLFATERFQNNSTLK